MTTCSNCGAENPAGQKFCGECGAQLAAVCSNCGAINPTGQKFCGECGTSLAVGVGAASPTDLAVQRVQPPAAERRLVSVLFADLVGFTAASASRDPEDTRELLTRYFEIARTLVARYGGTVEKFIGDAVMAVWGTPLATEDDAERAVRAALDLAAAVPELGSALQARAGVLTGEAAVTIGAEGEGMVAGDLVNTASRIQTAAEPGTVLVGESTRRVTEQTIAYEQAGEYELKGKAGPVVLYRALRVVSGRGGSLRSTGLEAPFVGRDRELKLIKDLFHVCASDRRAHLVSVTGIAGIGKSRLAWEFYKYFDGIVDTVWWHRGRCLAYGEGVTYWALADMVRMRCRISEDEQPESARKKLSATLHEHLLDPEERSFVEPRLAHLLGFEQRSSGERQELFAAWRLFFERLADSNPTVLAFEDMQWADTSLLDFVEYLLEWSRDYPLYVITLARPELHERRSGWGAGQRSFTSLYLEPLSQQSMEALLDGLVPGLPERLHEQIMVRAEGVPLYAVETVRMLLDRRLLAQDGPVYRPTGEIETLEVPETLHALIAARLDGLSAEERRLLEDGAVLGKTFTVEALAAISGSAKPDLDPLLAALVRKEVLGVQSDARSPEHGQYGFLQDLVRHVAYETLSRRERKSRHLAAAKYLTGAFADIDEMAEVLAAHYLAAYEVAPEASDAQEIRRAARDMLARAGKRAGSLGAPEEGQRYFARAAELADEPLGEAELLEAAARLGLSAARREEARLQLEGAIELFEGAGQTGAAARATAGLVDFDLRDGFLDEAATRIEAVLPLLEELGPTPELAENLAQLGRIKALRGEGDRALGMLERALRLAEKLGLEEVLVQALTSKALAIVFEGRFAEGRVLLEGAMDRARAAELHSAWDRAAGNLGVLLQDSDRHLEVLEISEELEARARQLGDRDQLAQAHLGQVIPLIMLGRWAKALALADEAEKLRASDFARFELVELAVVQCERGNVAEAERIVAMHDSSRNLQHPEAKATLKFVDARLRRAQGRYAEALAAAEGGLAFRNEMSFTNTRIKRAFVEAVEAALSLGDHAKAAELMMEVEALHPGELTPFLTAHRSRFHARLDSVEGGPQEEIDSNFRSAAALFREFGLAFYLAVTELEHAEWLTGQGRFDEAAPLFAEARATFEQLEARPWLERTVRASQSERQPETLPGA